VSNITGNLHTVQLEVGSILNKITPSLNYFRIILECDILNFSNSTALKYNQNMKKIIL
jgi:hypothetical protein